MWKMKRFTLLALFAVLTLLVAACGSKSNSSDQGSADNVSDTPSNADFEITLIYSDHDPPGGMRTEFIEKVWIPEIEQQTGGRVKINANFGGALLTSGEALDAIKDGVVDMGLIFPDFYPEKLFGFQIFRLFPEAPEKWENISLVFEEALAELPQLRKELEENHNQKPLLVTVGLPSVFGATYPIDNIGDIQGKNWRASSRWHLESLKHIGSNPVSVPWEDVYMSLATGVIDGVLTNYDGFHMMKFYESAPEIIVAPQLWWATPFVHTINLDTWNSLPADIQDGIMKATEIAQEKFGEVFASALEKTIEEQRAHGANVKIAERQDIEAIVDPQLLANLRNIWIDEAKNLHGIEDAEAYINKMDEIMKKALEREQ